MNWLKESFLAKIIATILLVVFSATFLITAVGYDYIRSNPEVDYAENYYNTQGCASSLRYAAQDIYYRLTAETPLDAEEMQYFWYSQQQRNHGDIDFAVYSDDGELLYTSRLASDIKNAGHIHTIEGEDFTVKTYVARDLEYKLSGINLNKAVFDFAKAYGQYFLSACVLSALIAIAAFIFLTVCAGHKAGVEGIHLNMIDRMSLEMLFICGGLMIAFPVALFEEVLYQSFGSFALFACCVIALIIGFAVLGMYLSLVTRIKAGKFWLNSWSYKALIWCLKWLKIIWKKLIYFVKSAFLGIRSQLHEIPFFWKTFLILAAVVFIEFLLTLLSVASRSDFYILLSLVYNGFLLLAATKLLSNMLHLKRAGERLATGDLDGTVDTSGMYWDFAKHGENLNRIADGIALAVEDRIKSERLKTELITNVSHDIKTPLTSIVNYVDLIKKEEPEGKVSEYVEVLDRQSARLKKLTEDLVEASKASTGNISVNLNRTDVCEIARQSIGEYTERFEGQQLELVSSLPQNQPTVMADGRLLWRIIDNLLSNACKYSMPKTRVYLDVRSVGGMVNISVKNISRDMLNIDPSELTERFVRGDLSRNTEGSGLGLNIARSLTELQNGEFKLSVDGDLFKAEVVFNELV